MSDMAAEVPAEPVPPAPEAAAELETTRPEAEVPAPVEAPVLPEIEYPIGPVRQGVLDHLLDSEGPQTVAQIIAGLGNYSRNTVESAIKREFDAGRIERVAPGTYRLAPARPAEPPKPALTPDPEPGRDEISHQVWFDALEAWLADSSSWDISKLGPPPDARDHRVPLGVAEVFSERLRKREQRRRDAEAAAAKRAAADRELRDKLIAATHGNYTPGPGIEDVSPIRAALEVIPIDDILSAVRSKTDRRLYPKNEPATSWREPRLLKAIAEHFCRFVVVPSMVP